MTQPLAQATILSTAQGGDYESYISAVCTKADELIRIDEHPNASKTSTGIYIEDVRNLQEMVRTAKQGIRTIIVFNDAARLTTQAQNALLKLLEEPRDRLYIILCTTSPTQLLKTVRSRSQTVTLQPGPTAIDIPDSLKARIQFMAGNSIDEQKRLATDAKYLERRSKLFGLAKQFVGGSAYERLVIVKQVSDKRESSLEFIDVLLRMYSVLISRGFSERLRDEAAVLLDIDQAIRANGNHKLQLLRAVV